MGKFGDWLKANKQTFGSGLLGGFNVGVGILQSAQQNKYQKEAAEEAWKREVEMWNMQNMYNTPEQQMKRYLEAGLNPNLIYGGGSATAGLATHMPRYQKPDYKFKMDPDLVGTMSGLQNTKLSMANQQYVEAKTQHEGQKQVLTEINAQLKDTQNRLLKIEEQFKFEKEYYGRNILKWTDQERQIHNYNLNLKGQLIEEQAGLYNLRKALLAQQVVQLQMINKYLPADQVTSIISRSLGTAAGAFVGGTLGVRNISKLKGVKLPKNFGEIKPNYNF